LEKTNMKHFLSSTTSAPFYAIDGRKFTELSPEEQLAELVRASNANASAIVNPSQELLARVGQITRPTLRAARRQARSAPAV
jgi:hypothetical protein